MSTRRDFWLSSGHHLLDRNAEGRLVVTEEFLKAYLARPELVPPPEACDAERGLHQMLLRNPRAAITVLQIADIADADARENWEMMIAWRDHLVRHDTIEAAYLNLVRHNVVYPRIFIDQLVHLILRNLLDDCDDAFVLRASELFFRPQKVRLDGGQLTVSDDENTPCFNPHAASPLYSLLGMPAESGNETLCASNADSYWDRSDLFDFALDLRGGEPGAAAFILVLTRWISHLLAIDTVIDPLTELREAPLSWYVGLDAEATRIGDLLWRSGSIDDAARARLIALYRLIFVHPADMIESVRGEPVYVLMAVDEDGLLQMKPHNIINGLPIRSAELVK
ncbi:hypothetical protein G3545_26325 [Starkeya sp. ORNL1]|uniref:DUF6352 family protein n=1 Tax=Starkeya sp. ORNL1 TaxID=2709380 RepID=UPI001462C8B7|nr:DUF6352 family protein [Starkeya sp. ORNL1]QJP16845.1 hypothetical protein G3545_26325 [Starkeya sp. ORNL1]